MLNIQRSIAIIVALATLAGCSRQPTPAAPAKQEPQASITFDPATAATITGVVHFTGPVPKPLPIDMSEDPACKGQNAGESLAVHDGRLANVVVYIKSGLPGNLVDSRFLPVQEIHQKNCRYAPHVIAIIAGGRVSVLNDDPTTHNVHPMPHANKEWNASQSPRAEPIVKTFSQPELMIPVKCNVHPWMRAYINVMSNPFYRVTADDGSFTIIGLPPGTYTIAAVHETLGEQTAQVTVGPKEKKVADFTFNEAGNTASIAR